MGSGPTKNVAITEAGLTPKGYEQITGLSSVKTLTVPADAQFALIQVESKDVRWRDDGTDPTASVGMLLLANQDIWYANDLSKLKFIETAASAKLNVAYYGY